jgi:hypothetical protein
MNKSYILLVLVFLVGCASIVSKSTYPVAVSSEPSGAQIVVTDNDGETVYEGTTPANIDLTTTNGYFSGQDYSIRASLAGHETTTMEIERGVDGWYVANILFGGLIGLLIVDPLTGAMWKLDEQVTVELTASEPASQLSGMGLRVLSFDQLPLEHIKHLVRIK